MIRLEDIQVTFNRGKKPVNSGASSGKQKSGGAL
ncbi:hypothetical protein VVS222_00854 [Vibrio vulnificus]|nr:hypothetical protein VVS222_00854 [Vibrio vulnificus]